MKPPEAYIYQQPEAFIEIMLMVCTVVSKALPDAQLLLKWGIPYFYYQKKPFLYLAPNAKNGYVDVGFAKGFQLTKHLNYLVAENRNTVKSLRYFSIEEINLTILRELIAEAKTVK